LRVWLLDTGPLVAYLNTRDPDHERVAATLDAFSGQLIATSAVITESMYFLAQVRRGPALLAAFVADSELQIVDFSGAEDLADAARRMEKYADLPMDYPDATLVLLAERLGIFDVLTLDRRGFKVYRTTEGKHFALVLDATL
jgi:uncharacterized protein